LHLLCNEWHIAFFIRTPPVEDLGNPGDAFLYLTLEFQWVGVKTTLEFQWVGVKTTLEFQWVGVKITLEFQWVGVKIRRIYMEIPVEGDKIMLPELEIPGDGYYI
jgi:hypothetical protein